MGSFIRMIALRLLPLLCLASADYWPALKTTFGLNPFGEAFHPRPRTVAEAEAEGWILIDSCNGAFLGSRYVDPSLILIYDVAGFIAGSQSGMLKSNIAENVPLDTNPAYQLGDFFGEPAWFTTAYFVDPAVICEGGRTQEEFDNQGTGDRLIVQTGPTPDSLLDVPLTQDAADADPEFYDHYCFIGMGDHYMQFNYQPDQDCFSVLPLQILYDKGVITGFVWQHVAYLPGSKWEHPDRQAISMIVDRPPTCLDTIVESPGLSTMHHYFYEYPWLTLCPLKYDRNTVQGYKKVMKM